MTIDVSKFMKTKAAEKRMTEDQIQSAVKARERIAQLIRPTVASSTMVHIHARMVDRGRPRGGS